MLPGIRMFLNILTFDFAIPLIEPECATIVIDKNIWKKILDKHHDDDVQWSLVSKAGDCVRAR